MTAVKHLLDPAANGPHLLTLIGAGGSGKTRLAIQVATDLIDRFAHGVWRVELAALNQDEQVVQAVAKTLGVNEAHHEPAVQSVGNFLSDKQLLLVLDNCEHLIALFRSACRRIVESLSQSANSDDEPHVSEHRWRNALAGANAGPARATPNCPD